MKARVYTFRGALLLLAGVHVLALFAGFFAPCDFAAQNREMPFAPPTRLHWVDSAHRLHLRPFVCAWTPVPEVTDRFAYTEDCSRTFPLKFLTAGSSYTILGIFPTGRHLLGLDSPGQIYLLGTDQYGRDVFSRLIYACRISLFAGLLAALLSLVAGLGLGSAAGFYGGWVDEGMMRFGELFLALPWLYLLFAVRAFLPLHVSSGETFLLLIAVIGIVGWARPARLVRGVVLSAKERSFVLAARGFGASDAYLLRRHVWPATYAVLLTQGALLVPQYVQAEVVMSFLGLGVSEPVPSLGNMLTDIQSVDVLTNYWWMASPALALVIVFLLYDFFASYLQRLTGSSAS